MHLEELALRIRTYHGRSRGGSAQDLNHRIDKGRCLTAAGSADNQSVHGRSQINLQLLLLCGINRTDRNTVLLLFVQLCKPIRLKIKVSFLIRHESRILKRALDSLCLSPQHPAPPLCRVICEQKIQQNEQHNPNQTVQIGPVIQKQLWFPERGSTSFCQHRSKIHDQCIQHKAKYRHCRKRGHSP